MGRGVTATLACVGVLSMAIGVSVASAQSSARVPGRLAVQRATAPIDEHHFVVRAAIANMADVQLGHLATEKAQHADVKKFAQRMIDEHLQSQRELAEAAYGAGIKWPKQLDDRNRQIRQRLSTVKQDQFDQEYMKAMIDGHREVEEMLAARSSEPQNSKESTLAAKVNQWAAKTLPAVRAHLQEAERVSSELSKAK